MKKLLTMLACILVVGCDYTVPLVTTPKIEIDKAILGLWQTIDNGKTQRLLVLALDSHEYLVSYSFDDGGMFARACLCHADHKTFVQLKWVGTTKGEVPDEKNPDDKRVYQFATYSVTGDKLAVRLLNTDVVPGDVASTKELLKSIAANRDNPKLLKEEVVFTKVKP
jgi:hypothetical protein